MRPSPLCMIRVQARIPLAALAWVVGFLVTLPLPLRAADPADSTVAPAAAPSDPLAPAPPIPPVAIPANGVTLQACYEEAIRNDPVIRATRAAFEEALGAKIVLQSIALPDLNVGVVTGDQGPRYNTPSPHSEPFILATGSLTQPVFNAAIAPSFHLGRVNVAVAEQKFNQAVTNELYAIRLSFYNALTARAGIEVEQSLQGRLQANLKAQQDQLAVGKVSHSAVSLASYQLSAIAPGLAQARGDYRNSQIKLAQSLGRDLGSATAADADAGLPYPVGTLESTPFSIDIEKETAYALTHRADLQALRLLIDATQQNKRIAESSQYPTIALAGNIQFIPESLIHKSGTLVQQGAVYEDTETSYGISGSWVVTDGGSAKALGSEYQAQKEGYQIKLKQLEDTVPLQLQQVDGTLQKAFAQLDGSEKNVALAEENFRQVEAQVANGDLPQLDFLNAQSNLLQARFNRINALLENNTAIADLDVITGRYLQFLAPPASSPPQK